MFKKFIMLFCLVTISLNAQVYFPVGILSTTVNTAAKKQIAWDIHGPIAVKGSGNLFNRIGLGFSYVVGNSAWDEINRVSQKNDISGEGQAAIAAKHGHRTLAKMIRREANSYKPREGIEQVIRHIHNTGIPQRIASNIGSGALADMRIKFKKKYKSTIFDVLSSGMAINFGAPMHSSAIITSNVGKPHSVFFRNFSKQFNPDGSGFIIFIDDKIENIMAATKEGWIGIHFDLSKKDAIKHLKADLVSLGIKTF